MTQPTPGDVYERDGQTRGVTSCENGIVRCFVFANGQAIGRAVLALETWQQWAAAARKVETGEGE